MKMIPDSDHVGLVAVNILSARLHEDVVAGADAVGE
jgi:hypothetical protein